jgi:hypothetical protein
MVHSYLVERDGPTGKIQRVFLFDIDGIQERAQDIHGRLTRRFVFDHEHHAILEYTGEKDERVKRTLSYQPDSATISEGGKYGKITRTFQFKPELSTIVEREGTKFGPVRRTYLFDARGILEKEGEEYRDRRMFIFDAIGSITEREGGWYGTNKRIFIGEQLNPETFRDFTGFLQLLFLIG